MARAKSAPVPVRSTKNLDVFVIARTLHCCISCGQMMTVILASSTILAVLLGPILVKPIERNVEFFFLLVGVLTACVMGQFDARAGTVRP